MCEKLISGPFNAGGAQFSPDGRWVAYVSDESSRKYNQCHCITHSTLEIRHAQS